MRMALGGQITDTGVPPVLKAKPMLAPAA